MRRMHPMRQMRNRLPTGRIRRSTGRPSNEERSGVIIFVVVVVIAMAALAGYTYVVAVQGDNKAAHLGADQLQTEHLAESGEAFVSGWLAQSRSIRSKLDENLGPEVFAQNVTRPNAVANTNASSRHSSVGRFYIVQPRLPAESQRTASAGFGASVGTGTRSSASQTTRGGLGNSSLNNSSWQLGVVNESGKLHLGTLLHWDQIWPGSGRNALLNLPGMTSETADAILDWVDADNEPREFGAESDVYTKQPSPYRAANKLPASLEELLLVRGVTPRLLFADISPNAQQDRNAAPGASRLPATNQSNQSGGTNGTSNASPLSRESNQSPRPWSHFLTVYSGERDEAFDGGKRIFVNGDDLGALNELEDVDEDITKFIKLFRQYGRVNPIVVPVPESEPEQENDQLTATPDNSSEPEVSNESTEPPENEPPTPTTNSPDEEPEGDYLEIDQVELDVTGSPAVALVNILDLLDAIVPLPPEENEQAADESDESEPPTPRFVRSPITTKSLGDSKIAAALERLTLVPKPVPVFGRLNLYLAPIEVIAGLPMLESGQAAQIEAARDTADPLEAQQSLSWLYRADVLPVPVLYGLSPYLTTGGDVVSFQVIGAHGTRRLYHRYAATLDGTYKGATRRIAFRDLRRSGSPGIFDDLPVIPGTTSAAFQK